MTLRFLVDAQLPPALARWLAEQGHEAEHVYDIGLASASDRRIWDYAARQNAVIVTKDEDFVALRTVATLGPAVVWIRIGNAGTRTLIERLAPVLHLVERSIEAGERLVEVA